MTINGNNFLVYINGTKILDVTSTSLSMANSLYEATISPSKSYDEVISGRRKVTFQVEALGLPDPSWSIGDEVTYRTGVIGKTYTALCLIESIDVTGASDEAVGYSMSLATTGAYEKFIPIFGIDKLITNLGDQIITDTGDRICVVTQIN